MTQHRHNDGRPFPTRVFLAAVGAVCLGLAVSAVYGFLTLSRLHDEVLRNRGNEIVQALDVRVRGPGRRNSPAIWQEEMEESLKAHADWVAFLVLLDQSGSILASAGEIPPEGPNQSVGLTEHFGSSLYVLEEALPAPLHTRSGVVFEPAGWRIRVGLHTGPAASILRQAIVNVVISALAILTLIGVAAYVVVTLRRVIELKSREQSQRHLAMIGKMAATLAHEIRNPLGAMKGLTQVVQEELPKDHQAQNLIQTVVSEAERLERLVIDLLTFARPRDSLISRFELRSVFTEVTSMLDTRLSEERIKIDVVADVHPLPIQSDENGVRQVILNILLNAIDASPRGGKVTIRPRLHDAANQVCIEVEDEGKGLGDRDPEEYFQPFMTTKLKGTGLGLPISRQIVERLGGRMTLANRPEGGARCTITLPARLR